MVRLKEINGNRFDEVKVYKQETEAKRERDEGRARVGWKPPGRPHEIK